MSYFKAGKKTRKKRKGSLATGIHLRPRKKEKAAVKKKKNDRTLAKTKCPSPWW